MEELQVCCGKRIHCAVYSLAPVATTCAALLGHAWIWFDLLCWVFQSVSLFWKGQRGQRPSLCLSLASVSLSASLPLSLCLSPLPDHQPPPLCLSLSRTHTLIFKDSFSLLGET